MGQPGLPGGKARSGPPRRLPKPHDYVNRTFPSYPTEPTLLNPRSPGEMINLILQEAETEV